MRSVLFILVVLGILVGEVAAENFFSSSPWVKSVGSGGGVANPLFVRHPLRDETWRGVSISVYGSDHKWSYQMPSSVLPTGYVQVFSVSFDDMGNAWIAHVKGLTRYSEASKLSTHYSAGLPTLSGFPRVDKVIFDKVNNCLLAGCTGGFASSSVSSAGEPSGFEVMIPDGSDKTIHQIGVYGSERWALNSAKVYRFVNGAWTGYTPADIGLAGLYSAFVDSDGNAWVGGSELWTDGRYYGALVKFDRQSGSWGKVVVDGLSDGSVKHLVIDRNRILWIDGGKALLKIDLAASPLVAKKMDKGEVYIALNSDDIYLGLNPVGGLMVSSEACFEDTTGLGAYYKSVSSVIRPRIGRSLFSESGQFVGTFSINGRLANPNNVLSSGSYVSLFRTADGRSIVGRHLSLIANPSQR